MPFVNIQITQEGGDEGRGATVSQKSELIKGVTELLFNVLQKDPQTTHVVISEVPLDNWGIAGLTVNEYRQVNKK